MKIEYIPYKLLLKQKEENEDYYISYRERLLTTEWKNKRERILSRDKFKCADCNSYKTKFRKGKYFRQPTLEEIKKQNEWNKKKQEEFHDIVISFGLDPKKIGRLEPTNISSVRTDEPIILYIHHTYYIDRNLPWEYPDDALITLCHRCHQKTHKEIKIIVYSDERMINEMDLTKCLRCEGTGYLEQFHYYLDGICFRCNGEKYDELIEGEINDNAF